MSSAKETNSVGRLDALDACGARRESVAAIFSLSPTCIV
jgi:hypothetical protein